jgi:hypothetical protein
MMFAIFLHLIVTVWIYGNTQYFNQNIIISSISANGITNLYNIPARLLSIHTLPITAVLALVTIFILVKLFSLDYLIYSIFCECCSNSQQKIEGVKLLDALSTQACFKNHIIRNNQYVRIQNVNNFRFLYEFYQNNFLKEREAIVTKLENLGVDYDKEEIIYNFDETVEKALQDIHDTFPLQKDYSYNIAHIPEYEAYAK